MRRQYNVPAIDDHARSHPDYDFDMEILATLPPLGNKWSYVGHREMAWDHRMKTQKPVAEAIERLGARYKIQTWRAGGERVSALCHRD